MYITKQGGRIDYNLKEIFLDNISELNNLSTDTICPGSVVYIVDTGTVYILNSLKQWIKQTNGGGGSGLVLEKDKSVTYSANGNYEITPDVGFDGLENALITINVQPNLIDASEDIVINGTYNYNISGSEYDGYRSLSINVDVPTSGGGDTDWTEVGYLSTPQDIQNDFNYAKSLYDNWDNSTTNMDYMFSGNQQIKHFPLVDTSNVTSMNGTFTDSSLEYLPELDILNVVNMNSTFASSKLKEIPLLNFSENLNELSNTFYNTQITSIPEGLNTSNISIFDNTFSGNAKLTNVSLFDTLNATNINYIFYNIPNINSYPLFNFSNVTHATGAFSYNYDLITIPQFHLDNIIEFNECFCNDSSLRNIPQFYLNNTIQNMDNLIQSDAALTNESLNNILYICNHISNEYYNTKTLQALGFNEGQAWVATHLSNYNNAIGNGWSLGYDDSNWDGYPIQENVYQIADDNSFEDRIYGYNLSNDKFIYNLRTKQNFEGSIYQEMDSSSYSGAFTYSYIQAGQDGRAYHNWHFEDGNNNSFDIINYDIDYDGNSMDTYYYFRNVDIHGGENYNVYIQLRDNTGQPYEYGYSQSPYSLIFPSYADYFGDDPEGKNFLYWVQDDSMNIYWSGDSVTFEAVGEDTYYNFTPVFEDIIQPIEVNVQNLEDIYANSTYNLGINNDIANNLGQQFYLTIRDNNSALVSGDVDSSGHFVNYDSSDGYDWEFDITADQENNITFSNIYHENPYIEYDVESYLDGDLAWDPEYDSDGVYIEGDYWHGVLTGEDLDNIDFVEILMGGQDITNEVWNWEEKSITISSIEENVHITITAGEPTIEVNVPDLDAIYANNSYVLGENQAIADKIEAQEFFYLNLIDNNNRRIEGEVFDGTSFSTNTSYDGYEWGFNLSLNQENNVVFSNIAHYIEYDVSINLGEGLYWTGYSGSPIEEGEMWTGSLGGNTANIDSVEIIMGGQDITNEVWYPEDYYIEIPNVSGNISITITTTDPTYRLNVTLDTLRENPDYPLGGPYNELDELWNNEFDLVLYNEQTGIVETEGIVDSSHHFISNDNLTEFDLNRSWDEEGQFYEYEINNAIAYFWLSNVDFSQLSQSGEYSYGVLSDTYEINLKNYYINYPHSSFDLRLTDSMSGEEINGFVDYENDAMHFVSEDATTLTFDLDIYEDINNPGTYYASFMNVQYNESSV